MQVPQELLKVGFSRNIVGPYGTGANRCLIVGEAPGAEEDSYGVPFCPHAQAGSVLERAIRRVGMNREQFAITNVVPARPPNNYLEGAPWMADAVAWGRPQLEATITQYRPKAILALGGVALRTLTGLAGPKLGISHLTGYILPSLFGPPVVACYHPSFLRRGKMSLMSVLMRCVRLAVQVAAEGRQAIVPDPNNPPAGYVLRPSPEQAEAYLLGHNETDWLALDIETPWSNAEDEAEEHEGDITSIQFSWGQDEGIFMPWREPYIDIAKRALTSINRKSTWNGYRFDFPRLRMHGCDIKGELHDFLWMWHHANPDLPRGLQFSAAMQGPNITQPTHVWPFPWKNLSGVNERFYGIVDVDVLSWMAAY